MIDYNNEPHFVGDEQPPDIDTKNNQDKGHEAWEKAKKALILMSLPFIMRGAIGGHKDLVKAKEFLETKGYDLADYAQDTYGDILGYSEDTDTIVVGQPATIDTIVQRNLGVSKENIDKVVDYVDALNADNTKIYKNANGELSADSQLELPSSISVQSPIMEILKYVYGDEIDSFTSSSSDSTETQLEYTIENGAGFSNEFKTVTIEDGDSLDGYAHMLCNEAGIQSTSDIIDTIINFIKNINNLSSDLIVTGSQIKLPSNLPDSFKTKNNAQPIYQTATESHAQY